MPNPPSHEHRSVTKLLRQVDGDDHQRLTELYDKVQQRFRSIAKRLTGVSYNRPETTELLDDAFLKLTSSKHLTWENRASFYAAAATTMRRMVCNHYRALGTAKNNYGKPPLSLSAGGSIDITNDPAQIVEINDLIERLTDAHPSAMKVFDMSVFGGETYREIADLLDIKEHQVRALMKLAKTLIRKSLEPNAH